MTYTEYTNVPATTAIKTRSIPEEIPFQGKSKQQAYQEYLKDQNPDKPELSQQEFENEYDSYYSNPVQYGKGVSTNPINHFTKGLVNPKMWNDLPALNKPTKDVTLEDWARTGTTIENWGAAVGVALNALEGIAAASTVVGNASAPAAVGILQKIKSVIRSVSTTVNNFTQKAKDGIDAVENISDLTAWLGGLAQFIAPIIEACQTKNWNILFNQDYLEDAIGFISSTPAFDLIMPKNKSWQKGFDQLSPAWNIYTNAVQMQREENWKKSYMQYLLNNDVNKSSYIKYTTPWKRNLHKKL